MMRPVRFFIMIFVAACGSQVSRASMSCFSGVLEDTQVTRTSAIDIGLKASHRFTVELWSRVQSCDT